MKGVILIAEAKRIVFVLYAKVIELFSWRIVSA